MRREKYMAAYPNVSTIFGYAHDREEKNILK